MGKISKGTRYSVATYQISCMSSLSVKTHSMFGVTCSTNASSLSSRHYRTAPYVRSVPVWFRNCDDIPSYMHCLFVEIPLFLLSCWSYHWPVNSWSDLWNVVTGSPWSEKIHAFIIWFMRSECPTNFILHLIALILCAVQNIKFFFM